MATHRFLEADIVDVAACRDACHGVDIVLHQAALGSVPRSIDDPLLTHAANATGFLNMLVAARDAGVARFVYAASSSTYGDHPGLPKVEDEIGRPLSPYAVTKYVDELYADVFARCYGMEATGLRYFNVFGSRQDPEGAYAAVIPRWVDAMLRGASVVIHGDGETSRDFCHVANVVQANLLAATSVRRRRHQRGLQRRRRRPHVAQRTARDVARTHSRATPGLAIAPPVHGDFRAGDVRHSQADIGKAQRLLGYAPAQDLRSGLRAALPWYEANSGASPVPLEPETRDVRGTV